MRTSLRIDHVVGSIALTGGPSYTVPALCQALGELGERVFLHVLEPAPRLVGRAFELRAYPHGRLLRRIGSSPLMKAGLRAAAVESDVLHGHGMWALPNLYPSRAVQGTSCRLVVSPRGMLDPWAMRHHRLRKKPLWLGGQRANLEHAACIHATAEQEYRFVRDLGFRAPVLLLPNGVHVPRDEDCVPQPQGRRRLLFLARIHEKKGVDVLLRAWKNVEERFPDWELRIVGPDDGGYLAPMRELAAALGTRRAVLTGYVPEERKPAEFRGAELYVLPTHTENWGMSIAEALSYGLPAIVGRGAPWSELVKRDCGWWIPNTTDDVTACLETALDLSPEELREKGRRGRAWVAEFRWERIAARTAEAYRWLILGGSPPDCVLLD